MKGVINPSVEARGEGSAERSPQMGHIRMWIPSSDVRPREDRKHRTQYGLERLEHNHIEVKVLNLYLRSTGVLKIYK